MPRESTSPAGQDSDAANVGYRPETPGDWTTAPEDVHAALEELGGAGGAGPHTIASHSDTTATGAELETLTDGSGADALHNHAVDGLSDADTTTDAPVLNDVLKWNGSDWVPGTAGDTTEFTFSIDSFDGTETDANQLIGSGAWVLSGNMSFSATYSNAPGGMTATVTMTGTATGWSTLAMVPVTGAEPTVADTSYPATAGDTVTFTLTQSADASTAVDTVTFNNTMRYGNSTLTQGNQTEATLEALADEVSGPNESRSQTINNIATTANQLVFAYADRLSVVNDIEQVRRNSGNGYVTASFNSTRTTVAPLVQAAVLNVDNSAGYSEDFACITSTDTGLANGTNDFQVLTSGTAMNYLRGGGNTEGTPGNYTEADIESGLTDAWIDATNDHTQLWPTVTLAASEHYVIAIPSRLGTPTFKDNDTGFEASFQSPATLAITNDAGFQENFNIFVSTNPLGPGDFNLLTE